MGRAAVTGAVEAAAVVGSFWVLGPSLGLRLRARRPASEAG